MPAIGPVLPNALTNGSHPAACSQAVKANTTYCALHTTADAVLAVGELKSGPEAAEITKNSAAGSTTATAGLMLLAALLAVLL